MSLSAAHREKLLGVIVPLGVWFFSIFSGPIAFAQGSPVLTPTVPIYPGDVLTKGALRQGFVRGALSKDPDVVRELDQVVGMIARRTLLPGEVIRSHMVAAPVRVRSGANVRVIFEDRGVSVFSSGIALQSGSVGDTIRIRNSDSGVVISGTVQGAGYIRVSGQ